jgi:hypothetical protein
VHGQNDKLNPPDRFGVDAQEKGLFLLRNTKYGKNNP